MVDVTSFQSWNLQSNDLEAMMRFYCDVLGAEARSTQTLQRDKGPVEVLWQTRSMWAFGSPLSTPVT